MRKSNLIKCPVCKIKKRYIVKDEASVITRCKYCTSKLAIVRKVAKQYAIR